MFVIATLALRNRNAIAKGLKPEFELIVSSDDEDVGEDITLAAGDRPTNANETYYKCSKCMSNDCRHRNHLFDEVAGDEPLQTELYDENCSALYANAYYDKLVEDLNGMPSPEVVGKSNECETRSTAPDLSAEIEMMSESCLEKEDTKCTDSDGLLDRHRQLIVEMSTEAALKQQADEQLKLETIAQMNDVDSRFERIKELQSESDDEAYEDVVENATIVIEDDNESIYSSTAEIPQQFEITAIEVVDDCIGPGMMENEVELIERVDNEQIDYTNESKSIEEFDPTEIEPSTNVLEDNDHQHDDHIEDLGTIREFMRDYENLMERMQTAVQSEHIPVSEENDTTTPDLDEIHKDLTIDQKSVLIDRLLEHRSPIFDISAEELNREVDALKADTRDKIVAMVDRVYANRDAYSNADDVGSSDDEDDDLFEDALNEEEEDDEFMSLTNLTMFGENRDKLVDSVVLTAEQDHGSGENVKICKAVDESGNAPENDTHFLETGHAMVENVSEYDNQL